MTEMDPRIGTGNWQAFPRHRMDEVFAAAESWKAQLAGIEKPWLCWCVDPDWCLYQQQLVQAVGWTPVVGTDTPTGRPPLASQSVFVNFNEQFAFKKMWMHFPLEFAFLFAERLAFWHSDVLPPKKKMETLAHDFDRIADGEYIGTRRNPDVSQLFRRSYRVLRSRDLRRLPSALDCRWFEVIGCTTQGASKSQFDHGCGFWRHIELHPRNARGASFCPYYEHGTGIWYWQRYHGGKAHEISFNIEPYHYTTKGKDRILMRGTINKNLELRRKYDVQEIARGLGLSESLT